MFKTIILGFGLCVLGVLATPPEFPVFVKSLFQLVDNQTVAECAATNNINPKDVLNKNMINTAEMGCFLKCVGEKNDLIKSDGSLNMDVIKTRPLPPGVTTQQKEQVENCLGAVRITQCQDVMKMKQCIEA